MVLRASRQLLNTHLNTAFAGHAHNSCITMGNLHPHRCWQAKAHGAETTGSNPTACFIEWVILRSKHLMLTYISRHKRIAFGYLINSLNHFLRFDFVAGGVEAWLNVQAMTLTPFVDLLPPCGNRFRIRTLF